MKINKRPPSYSEGYIYDLRLPLNEIDISIGNIRSKIDYIEIIYVKFIGFILHLVLIATFELIFFNFYIIQYENNALVGLTDQIISPLISSCSVLSNRSKIIVDDFIKVFVNKTTINNNAYNGYIQRQNVNTTLLLKSIYYYIGLIVFFIIILLFNIRLKKKIHFGIIVIDNIIMIMILGIYEYIFFKNIVFNYLMISPSELIQNIIKKIINTC